MLVSPVKCKDASDSGCDQHRDCRLFIMKGLEMSVIVRTVTDIVDSELRNFSMYTIENRAIPSAIDGFKPTQRKLVYAIINEYRGNKVKVAELGGGLAKLNYAHGETSAQGAVITLAADWSNNCPVFTGHGNFGSRLVPEAAAPRYIYVSLSPDFKKFFIDDEVAPPSLDQDNPEPAHYLPVIPWVLVNGISGIAVGFKTEILPRSVESLIAATTECLKSPQKFLAAAKPIPPVFKDFSGTVVQSSQNQWKTVGIITPGARNTYTISELPVGFDREAYVSFLNTLVDRDAIRDYDDNCSKSGFCFTIKVSAQQKSAIDADPLKFFKLERTHTEILTTIGHDGKLKIFDTIAQLIHYFVEYRTVKFDDKIKYDIDRFSSEKDELELKIKFIAAVIDGHVDFKKLTKRQLLDWIAANISTADCAKRFANIPLYECTADEVQKLQSKVIDRDTELASLQKLTPTALYRTRLSKLK